MKANSTKLNLFSTKKVASMVPKFPWGTDEKQGFFSASQQKTEQVDRETTFFPSLIGMQSEPPGVVAPEEKSNYLLRGLRQYEEKNKGKQLEQNQLDEKDIQKEESLPKKEKKQFRREIIKRSQIKEEITKKSSEVKKLKGKKADRINFEILNLKIQFNDLNNHIKEVKGYTDTQIADLKERDFTIRNIEDNYVLNVKEIDALKAKGLAVSENAVKYVSEEKSKPQKFDPKMDALSLVKIYLGEGGIKKDLQAPLSVADKLLILKYYKADSGNEYNLHLLRRFTEEYLLPYPEEVRQIFGYEVDQIKPENYMEILKSGVTSINKKRPGDDRMKKHHDQIYKEGTRRFFKGSEWALELETLKAEELLLKTSKLSAKEKTGPVPKRLEKRIKQLEKRLGKGYTGAYDIDLETAENYRDTLVNTRKFIELLEKVKQEKGVEKGEAPINKMNVDTPVGNLEISDPQNIPVTDEQLESKRLLTETPKLEYFKKILNPITTPLGKDLKKEAFNQVNINENVNSFLQNTILPHWNANKKTYIASGIAAGTSLVVPLGIFAYPTEAGKVKKGDFTGLTPLLNFIPDQHKEYSFGKNYKFGGKEYEKSKFEYRLKFHDNEKSPFLDFDKDGALSEKIINNTTGMNAADLRRGYFSPASPSIEFTMSDAVKKSGNDWLTHNWSIYLKNKTFLQNDANMGLIQALDQAYKMNGDVKTDPVKAWAAIQKIKQAVTEEDFNVLRPQNVSPRDKNIFDFQAGTKYTLGLGKDHKITTSGGILLLDLGEDYLQRMVFNMEYENKLFLGQYHNLKVTSKFGLSRQDMGNNLNLQKSAHNFNLGLAYEFGKPKKGLGSLSSSLEYIHNDAYNAGTQSLIPDDTYTFNAQFSYKVNEKVGRNNVIQSEFLIKISNDFKGQTSIHAFLILRPGTW